MAHVVQNHGISPDQVGRLTLCELTMYFLTTARDETDIGTFLCLAEAKEKLTLPQRIELHRRLMR